MSNCILCLNKTLKKNSVEISEVDESGLSIKEIIIQHFWFYEKILTFSSSQKLEVTCRSCWSKLEGFHEFFTAVKLSHKADHFEDEIETKIEAQAESILIKNEEEQNFAIEVMDVDDEPSNDGNFEDFEVEEEHLDESLMELEEQSEIDENPRRTTRLSASGFYVKPEPKKVIKKSSTKRTEQKSQVAHLSPEELKTLKLHTKFECEICNYKFMDWPEVHAHFKSTHKNKTRYIRCCGVKFKRTSELRDHITWHTNPTAFTCETCGKSFASKNKLIFHRNFHVPDEDRPFACDKCGKKFIFSFGLKNHMNYVHAKEDKEATLPCPQCDKFFRSEFQLSTHIFYVHKASEHICHVCSKVLKTKSSYKEHMENQHSNAETVECEICGHILKNKKRYKVHMRRHEQERNGPYPCSKGCGKLYKTKIAMQDHVSYVHSNKGHKCQTCDKILKDKTSLKEHEAGHIGIDLYSCPFCDRTFKSNGNMHSHKKKMHPEEYKKLPAPAYRGNVTIGDLIDE